VPLNFALKENPLAATTSPQRSILKFSTLDSAPLNLR
jgi:hypothetical protein